MALSQADIRRIAEYTRIGLSEDEVSDMTVYMNNVMDSLANITEFDLDGVEPTFSPLEGLTNVMREDVAEPSLDTQTALQNAGSTQGSYFKVPAILGSGE